MKGCASAVRGRNTSMLLWIHFHSIVKIEAVAIPSNIPAPLRHDGQQMELETFPS